MNFIMRAWRGEEKLWKVFWGGISVPPLAAVLLSFFYSGASKPYGTPVDHGAVNSAVDSMTSSAAWAGLNLLYCIAFCICIWRCSMNTGTRDLVIPIQIAVRVLALILAAHSLGNFVGALRYTSTSSTNTIDDPSDYGRVR